MILTTEKEYAKAKARLAQLSRHGDYTDGAEFERLADAVEQFEDGENEQILQGFAENTRT